MQLLSAPPSQDPGKTPGPQERYTFLQALNAVIYLVLLYLITHIPALAAYQTTLLVIANSFSLWAAVNINRLMNNVVQTYKDQARIGTLTVRLQITENIRAREDNRPPAERDDAYCRLLEDELRRDRRERDDLLRKTGQ